MTAAVPTQLSHLQPECSNTEQLHGTGESMLTGTPSQQCGSPRPAAGPKDCTKGTRPGALGADGPELRGTDVTGLYLPSKDSAGRRGPRPARRL
jgi:hypothetical protein